MRRFVLALLLALLCGQAAAQFYLPFRVRQNPPGTPDPGPAGQPQFIQNGGNVDVSWPVGVNTTSYNFFWEANDGSPGDAVFGHTTNSTSITIAEGFWFCYANRNDAAVSENTCNNWAPPPTQDLTVYWNAVGGDVTGYRVYYGSSPGSYDQTPGNGFTAGQSLSYNFSGLTGTKYIAATAFNAAGESGKSNELCYNFTTAAAC